VRTVFDHELVDPKAQINLVKGDDRFPPLFRGGVPFPLLRPLRGGRGGGRVPSGDGIQAQVVPQVPKGNRG